MCRLLTMVFKIELSAKISSIRLMAGFLHVPYKKYLPFTDLARSVSWADKIVISRCISNHKLSPRQELVVCHTFKKCHNNVSKVIKREFQ